MSNGWITQRGKVLEPFAQPGQKECWIASYRMILQANGMIMELPAIEKRLADGGFSQAAECRTRGLHPEELKAAGEALRMGIGSTKQIANFQGLRNMLMLCGPLWVAGRFLMSDADGVQQYFSHVIPVIGVNEEHNTICWVNPWKWNPWDFPSKAWIDWDWFYDAISNTFNIEGSMQYLTPMQAAVLSVTS